MLSFFSTNIVTILNRNVKEVVYKSQNMLPLEQESSVTTRISYQMAFDIGSFFVSYPIRTKVAILAALSLKGKKSMFFL